MDSDDIRQALYKERSQSLKPIPVEFYKDAAKYVRGLEEEMREIKNPRSPELKMLNGEYDLTTSFLETIFMKRIKKVINSAMIQAQAESNKKIIKDLENMLPTEKQLYELVLAGIEATKSEMLVPVLNPEAQKQPVPWPQPRGEVGQVQSPQSPQPLQTGPGEKQGKKAEAGSGKNNINKDYVLVRILKDMPTFMGADGRNYTVRAEDMVVLPRVNVTGLVKRKAAKLITGQETP